MSNLTNQMIIGIAADLLYDKLFVSKACLNTQHVSMFGRDNSPGNSIRIRIGQSTVHRDGEAIAAYVERASNMTLQRFYVDFDINSADRQLSVNDYKNRYLNILMTDLAFAIDHHTIEAASNGMRDLGLSFNVNRGLQEVFMSLPSLVSFVSVKQNEFRGADIFEQANAGGINLLLTQLYDVRTNTFSTRFSVLIGAAVYRLPNVAATNSVVVREDSGNSKFNIIAD